MAETKAKNTTKAPKAAKAAPAAAPKADAGKVILHRRSMVGIVISDKMMKTRVVRIERQVRDGMYGKYLTKARDRKSVV